MKIKISPEQNRIHLRAVLLAETHSRVERELIGVLGDIERTRTFCFFGHSSLFAYAVQTLGLSEALAYSLITLSRKGKDVPELKSAVENGSVSVSKASRIVSSITRENARS